MQGGFDQGVHQGRGLEAHAGGPGRFDDAFVQGFGAHLSQQEDRAADPRAELEARPERWFEKWWVWASVGAVVVAGVIATLIVVNRAPDNGIVEIDVTGGALR